MINISTIITEATNISTKNMNRVMVSPLTKRRRIQRRVQIHLPNCRITLIVIRTIAAMMQRLAITITLIMVAMMHIPDISITPIMADLIHIPANNITLIMVAMRHIPDISIIQILLVLLFPPGITIISMEMADMMNMRVITLTTS